MAKSWMDTIKQGGDEHLGQSLIRLAYEAVLEHQRQMRSADLSTHRPDSEQPVEVRR